MNTSLVDFINEGLLDKKSNLRIPTDYYKTSALASMIYYMLFDDNMTFGKFKEMYNKTISFNSESQKDYDISKDLMILYQSITGKNPSKNDSPVPRNSYIDSEAQVKNVDYNTIAKKENILY